LNFPEFPTDTIIWFYFLIISFSIFVSSYVIFSLEKMFIEFRENKTTKKISVMRYFFNVLCVFLSLFISIIIVGAYVFFIDIPLLNNEYYLEFYNQKTNGFAVSLGMCLTMSLLSPFYLNYFREKNPKINKVFQSIKSEILLNNIIFILSALLIVFFIFVDTRLILESLAINFFDFLFLFIYLFLLLILVKPIYGTLAMVLILIAFPFLPYFSLKVDIFFDYLQYYEYEKFWENL